MQQLLQMEDSLMKAKSEGIYYYYFKQMVVNKRVTFHGKPNWFC